MSIAYVKTIRKDLSNLQKISIELLNFFYYNIANMTSSVMFIRILFFYSELFLVEKTS